MIPFSVVRFCSFETAHQNDSAETVPGMVQAWQLINQYRRWTDIPTEAFIEIMCEMAEFIKPATRGKFRVLPVTVGNEVLTSDRIGERLEALCEAQNRLIAREFYTEFEKIHPFIDGNGRVGALLYNWRNGTLQDPVPPPDVFGDRS